MRRYVFALATLVVFLSIGAAVSFILRPPWQTRFVTDPGRVPPGLSPALAANANAATALVVDQQAGVPPARAGQAVPFEAREYPSPETSIVFSEVCYHPRGGDRRDEWIEILNRSMKPVQIGGWKLTKGVELTIPEGASIDSGKHLVLCADRARIASKLGIQGAIGDWKGALDDGGETITLVTVEGKEVDSLTYDDRAPFPSLPDGMGRTLERRCPHEETKNPANWGSSLPPTLRGGGEWVRLRTRGTATSNRLYLYLLAPGTVFVDDISLTPAGDDGKGFKEGFEGGGAAWATVGNHEGSRASSDRAHGGKRSMKVVASGAGSGRRAAAFCDIPGIEEGQRYDLEIWALFPPPRVPLVARFSAGGNGDPPLSIQTGASGSVDLADSSTPGALSSIHAASLPPLVFPVVRVPERPAPGEPIVVGATIAATAGVRQATLELADGPSPRSVPLHDDGEAEHGDAARGDGIWSAKLDPHEAGTLVFYRVAMEDGAGATASFPLEENPTRFVGFIVEPRAARTDLPSYGFYLTPECLQALDQNPFADAYQRGAFVHEGHVYCDVGFRYRGHTSRGIYKHHWKVKFQKDDPFIPSAGHRAVGSIDVNSSFGDKSFLREILAYDLWRDLGEASSEAWHTRVSLNGTPLGLYVYVENPGGDYLSRNHLEKGWLWKAYDDGQSGPNGFELKAGDPEAGTALLEQFLRNLATLRGEALESYIREHMQVESFATYLAACQVIHSADHVQKNYLVYASKEGKFTFYPWDMDLTHGRNFECGRGAIWNDVIRFDMWDRENRDQKLLFGTQVHPKCDGWVNAVIDAFLIRTEAFRPMYYRRIAELLAHYYHPDVLIPKVRRLRARVRDDVAMDRQRWGTYGNDAGIEAYQEELETWIRRRFDYLRGKLQALGYPVGSPLNADFACEISSGSPPFEARFRNLSAGEFASLEWDFGDGEKSDSREPLHIFQKNGRYDVTLRIIGPGGAHAQTRRDFVFVSK